MTKEPKCNECGSTRWKVLGVSGYDDTLEAECRNCGNVVEGEPDFLGEGGMEWVLAMRLSYETKEKTLEELGQMNIFKD